MSTLILSLAFPFLGCSKHVSGIRGPGVGGRRWKGKGEGTVLGIFEVLAGVAALREVELVQRGLLE